MSHKFEEKTKNLPEQYAKLWVKLVREGNDLYRDHVNTPAFFSILPPVQEKKGLDVGCGEGYNTRLLAKKGAYMKGVDISPTFIQAASDASPDGEISYLVQNATQLDFPDSTFDFTVSFFTLQEIIEYKVAIQEIYRVTKQKGFFQFCITHPCFWTPKLNWLKKENQKLDALIVKDYFKEKNEISKWMFDGVNSKDLGEDQYFETTFIKRTVSEWINTILEAGFTIEHVHEPKPSSKVTKDYPAISGSSIVPFFLIIRSRRS